MTFKDYIDEMSYFLEDIISSRQLSTQHYAIFFEEVSFEADLFRIQSLSEKRNNIAC